MYTVALRQNCLGFFELLAQAIALISPTMTAALIIPVMYSNTGDWSWLSYALGTVMLLFVALNLNQFARRSALAGSMYAYVRHGLGATAGGIAGWSLIWAYLGISVAGITGFSIFAGKLLAMIGLSVSAPILFLVCIGCAWFCAWKNVQLSAMLMLLLEGVSVALITVLCIVTLGQHGFAIDPAQYTLSSLHVSSLGLGIVVAIFSLVGFECATAFGEEARNPLKNIPRAVILSLVISGVFFVFVTTVMVQATHGYKTTLDAIDAPLSVLATLAHMQVLVAPLAAGAMLSFFALHLSCVNAGARIMYTMGRQGVLPDMFGGAHARNETPHVGITIMAALAFVVAFGFALLHVGLLDSFNDVGTLAAFGFIVPYVLVSLAAPVYLRSIGQMRPGHVALCVASLALLVIPAVGSVYPVPAAPVKYFPYLFLAYLAVGVALVVTRRGRPFTAATLGDDLVLTNAVMQQEG